VLLYWKQNIDKTTVMVSHKLWDTTLCQKQIGDEVGLAILFNEMDSEIMVVIFLFLYCIQEENKIGMQSLMLPAFSYKNKCEFVQSNLLYLLCMSVNSNGEKLPSVLQMECPVKLVLGKHMKGVLTKDELNQLKLQKSVRRQRKNARR